MHQQDRLHIVLVEPEIPPNTGSIARLCGATDSVLHLVHPLLVHAVLFGGGYVAQAERAASEALSLP